jgi:hypothetical protein
VVKCIKWIYLNDFFKDDIDWFRVRMHSSCHLVYHYSHTPDITWVSVGFTFHSFWRPKIKLMTLIGSYMYERVPTNDSQTLRVAWRSLLIPKSVSLASPMYELTRMLSGLTSLWSYFLSSCTYCNPFKVYHM